MMTSMANNTPKPSTRSLGRRLRSAARVTLLCMRYTRGILAGPIAVGDALACRQERLPRNAGRIVDPGLLRFGVAASGLALLDDVAAGFPQARVHLVQFIGVFDLDAEMIEAGFATAGRDRKIHARIVKHPFGVVRFDHGGLGREQRRVESDGSRNVADGDVNMQALHGVSFQAGILARVRAGLHSTAGAHGTPPQQLSVRYPISAFMVSNRAA